MVNAKLCFRKHHEDGGRASGAEQGLPLGSLWEAEHSLPRALPGTGTPSAQLTAEIAEMEASVREFQALRSKAASISSRVSGSAEANPALQAELQRLKEDILARKPHIQRVAQRIQELREIRDGA